MQFLAAGRIKVPAHHALPQIVDPERVQTDQHAGAFFHGPGLAAFADPDQATFGLDHHDVGGLVDHRLALPSLSIAGIAEVANSP